MRGFGFWKRRDRTRRVEPPLPPAGVLPCTHWERRGCTIGFGDYRLASFDRGRTWWGVSPDGSGVAPADPALLRQIEALDAVVRLAEEQPWLNRLSAPADRDVHKAAGIAPRRAD